MRVARMRTLLTELNKAKAFLKRFHFKLKENSSYCLLYTIRWGYIHFVFFHNINATQKETSERPYKVCIYLISVKF